MRLLTLIGTIAMTASAATAASAQDSTPAACRSAHAGHMTGGSGTGPATDMSAMSDMQKSYMQSMDRMHPAMAEGLMAADPDVAFLCVMIPHHRGAIDMAEVALRNAKDPWVRQVAQNVIDAQTREIAEMTKWLDEHAK